MNNKENLIKYYNKFTEDKRLQSKHGQVEMFVAMHYIKSMLSERSNPKVLDVGAGTGAYSIALSNLGIDVTAVELVKYNLGILKAKAPMLKAYQGDAQNLKRFKDNSFDAVLLFGPMYHLITTEQKLKALNECKRVVKENGLIFVSYLMNDYAVITYGFKEGNIIKSIKEGKLTKDFKIISSEQDLYSYVRVDDILNLSNEAGLERVKMVSQDGASDYIRQTLNSMGEKEFQQFLNYQLAIAERPELLGASSHILDILKKK